MPGIGELMIIMMILFVLPLTALWIWALVDCVTKEDPRERLPWLLLVIFAGVVGGVIYVLVRRPKRKIQLGR